MKLLLVIHCFRIISMIISNFYFLCYFLFFCFVFFVCFFLCVTFYFQLAKTMPEILGNYQKTFVTYSHDYMIFFLSVNNLMNKKILIVKPSYIVHKLLVTQSCPTLWYHMGYNPPGSSVHGILQAGKLEWVSISFSRGVYYYFSIH